MASKQLNKKRFIASHDSLNKAIDYKTIAAILNEANNKLENEMKSCRFDAARRGKSAITD